MLFFQYLAGCGNLSYPYLLPDIPEVGIFLDTMPLVEPNWDFADYYHDTSTYYKDNLSLMGLVRPLPNVSLNGVDFTEYRFTINKAEPQDIYALSSGYLYFVPRGQRSHLLGDVVADEDMLVLEPLRASKVIWRWYHPEFSPIIERVVYRNFNLDSDSLKEQIKSFHSEAFFRDLYRQVTGTEYSGPPEWFEAYWDLFLGPAEVAMLVQGTAVLGRTSPVIADSGVLQQLNMFFNVNGWSDNEESVKDFFRYRNRLPGLEGHPMIALLTGMPVEAGYVDYIAPLDLKQPWKGRLKDYLNRLPEPFNETPPYHTIAIDPDPDPAAIVIQKPPSSDLEISELPADHGITGLLVHKSSPLPIIVGDFNPNEVIVDQISLSDTEELVTFQATPASPESLPITVTTLDQDTGASIQIMEFQLAFFEFKKLPIRFHQLSDQFSGGTRTVNILPSDLPEVIRIANYILGRQANVYLSVIANDQNVTLEPLHFNEDLGFPLDVNGDSVTTICNQIWATPSTADCHVIFTWDLVKAGGPLRGQTIRPPSPALKPIILLTVHFPPLTMPPTKQDFTDVGFVLVHELGHWISMRFLERTRICAGDDKHFDHDACSSGHTTLYLNLMAAGESANSGKQISLEQAKIYNLYASQVQPQG